ncbi:hypothetical protein ACO0LB_18885 [Undibacterium sp. SXout7W]|uniref:hypothetical protein n=1 Tax=Undibacterium sp. SXout7W TaxID=3413049 RepID=UPI003BF0F7C0
MPTTEACFTNIIDIYSFRTILIDLIVLFSADFVAELQLLHADEQPSLHPRVDADNRRAADGER